jgi:hypothetical protein
VAFDLAKQLLGFMAAVIPASEQISLAGVGGTESCRADVARVSMRHTYGAIRKSVTTSMNSSDFSKGSM